MAEKKRRKKRSDAGKKRPKRKGNYGTGLASNRGGYTGSGLAHILQQVSQQQAMAQAQQANVMNELIRYTTRAMVPFKEPAQQEPFNAPNNQYLRFSDITPQTNIHAEFITTPAEMLAEGERVAELLAVQHRRELDRELTTQTRQYARERNELQQKAVESDFRARQALDEKAILEERAINDLQQTRRAYELSLEDLGKDFVNERQRAQYELTQERARGQQQLKEQQIKNLAAITTQSAIAEAMGNIQKQGFIKQSEAMAQLQREELASQEAQYKAERQDREFGRVSQLTNTQAIREIKKMDPTYEPDKDVDVNRGFLLSRLGYKVEFKPGEGRRGSTLVPGERAEFKPEVPPLPPRKKEEEDEDERPRTALMSALGGNDELLSRLRASVSRDSVMREPSMPLPEIDEEYMKQMREATAFGNRMDALVPQGTTIDEMLQQSEQEPKEALDFITSFEYKRPPKPTPKQRKKSELTLNPIVEEQQAASPASPRTAKPFKPEFLPTQEYIETIKKEIALEELKQEKPSKLRERRAQRFEEEQGVSTRPEPARRGTSLPRQRVLDQMKKEKEQVQAQVAFESKHGNLNIDQKLNYAELRRQGLSREMAESIVISLPSKQVDEAVKNPEGGWELIANSMKPKPRQMKVKAEKEAQSIPEATLKEFYGISSAEVSAPSNPLQEEVDLDTPLSKSQMIKIQEEQISEMVKNLESSMTSTNLMGDYYKIKDKIDKLPQQYHSRNNRKLTSEYDRIRSKKSRL